MRTYNQHHQQQQQQQRPAARHRHTVRTETDRRINCRGDVDDTHSGSAAGTEGCRQRMQQQANTPPALAHDCTQLALKYKASNIEL